MAMCLARAVRECLSQLIYFVVPNTETVAGFGQDPDGPVIVFFSRSSQTARPWVRHFTGWVSVCYHETTRSTWGAREAVDRCEEAVNSALSMAQQPNGPLVVISLEESHVALDVCTRLRETAPRLPLFLISVRTVSADGTVSARERRMELFLQDTMYLWHWQIYLDQVPRPEVRDKVANVVFHWYQKICKARPL